MEATPHLVRQMLAKSADPAVKEVANNPKLLKLLTEQLNKGAALAKAGYTKAKHMATSKTGQAVIFGGQQVATTLRMAGKVASPSALTALIIKKFLFTGKLVADITDSDVTKCGIAVGFLAAEGTVAVAGGIPTGGVATVLTGASVISSAYTAYDSCRKVKF